MEIQKQFWIGCPLWELITYKRWPYMKVCLYIAHIAGSSVETMTETHPPQRIQRNEKKEEKEISVHRKSCTI